MFSAKSSEHPNLPSGQPAEPKQQSNEQRLKARLLKKQWLSESREVDKSFIAKAIYRCTGRVEHHTGRGTQLGYPTANIPLSEDIPHGVYAGYVWIAGHMHLAAIFCGVAEMFGETQSKLEAHVLDFAGDLTDTEITVELISKIRHNQKFATREALVVQIEQDIVNVRTVLADAQMRIKK